MVRTRVFFSGKMVVGSIALMKSNQLVIHYVN
jgi:hypothetical protein